MRATIAKRSGRCEGPLASEGVALDRFISRRRLRRTCRRAVLLRGKPQHDPGAGVGGIALDAGFELGRHGGDDALAHAGGARIGLDVEADAVVGDRQHDIVALRPEVDMNRAGAVGIGVFHRVHHQLVDDDADRDRAVGIDLDGSRLQGQPRHLVALGGAAEILEQRVEILVQQHALEVVRGVEPAVHLRDRGDPAHGIGERGLDVVLRCRAWPADAAARR